VKRRGVLLVATLALIGMSQYATGQQVSGKTEIPKSELDLLGNWTGTSLCQVKPSPCHDETVIYRITKAKKPGTVVLQMDKIVDGKAEFMVTLDFTYDKETGALRGEMKNGLWDFKVKGNQIEGTLLLPDKTVYRVVSVKRQE
jgi:hypothetical protein